jgi:hypothetical protein
MRLIKPISFHPVTEDILRVLADIMNYYIENTTVSFHTEKLSESDMQGKVLFSNPASYMRQGTGSGPSRIIVPSCS